MLLAHRSTCQYVEERCRARASGRARRTNRKDLGRPLAFCGGQRSRFQGLAPAGFWKARTASLLMNPGFEIQFTAAVSHTAIANGMVACACRTWACRCAPWRCGENHGIVLAHSTAAIAHHSIACLANILVRQRELICVVLRRSNSSSTRFSVPPQFARLAPARSASPQPVDAGHVAPPPRLWHFEL